MGRASKCFSPVGTFKHKWYPDDIIDGNTPIEGGNVWFVDGDKSTGGSGKSWEDAFGESDFDGKLSDFPSTIAAGDVIYVAARTMAQTDTDPTSYTTNLTIDIPQVSIIGVSRGRTQGGLPQLKVGGTTTQAIITIAAPGCLIANLGINGSGDRKSTRLNSSHGSISYAVF